MSDRKRQGDRTDKGPPAFSCFLQKSGAPTRRFPVSFWKLRKPVRARSEYEPKPLAGRKPITQGRAGQSRLNDPKLDRERSPRTASRCNHHDRDNRRSDRPTGQGAGNQDRGAQQGARSNTRPAVGIARRRSAIVPLDTARVSGCRSFPETRAKKAPRNWRG